MSAFSPSLTLAGMDYIAPSAECILPTQVSAAAAPATATVGRHPTAAATAAVPAAAGVGAGAGRQEVLKITLQDCLACSGCVTTAETILVEAQSRKELCGALGLPPPPADDAAEEPTGAAAAAPPLPPPTPAEMAARRRRRVLVTVSEQSAASLAAHCGTTVLAAMEMVSGFFRAVLAAPHRDGDGDGDDAAPRPVLVSDLRWALQIGAARTAAEYQRRVAQAAGGGERLLPMLVSACPGWVCYCEKQGGALLPLLCPVLSPQGIAGSLAKRVIDEGLYHLSVQPCFDRKLEAARDGYLAEAGSDAMTPYTDCVLSTAELLAWMEETDAALPWRAPLDSAPSSSSLPPAPAGDARMEGSGGYHRRAIEAVAAAAAGPATTADDAAKKSRLEAAAAGGSGAAVEITYEVKRNRNHQIARWPSAGDAPFPHGFCVAYGFQQIQNIVRGIKKNLPAARQYTFIELMACPDGCLNGGGQIRVAAEPQRHAERLQLTEGLFADFLAATAGTDLADKERDEAAGGGGGERAFSPASVQAMVDAVGPDAFRCVFRDRQKEFEESLDNGNIHSLKW